MEPIPDLPTSPPNPPTTPQEPAPALPAPPEATGAPAAPAVSQAAPQAPARPMRRRHRAKGYAPRGPRGFNAGGHRPPTEKVNPQKAVDCVLVAAAVGRKAAARATGLSQPTVKRILDRNPDDMLSVRSSLSRRVSLLAERACQRVDRYLDQLSPMQSSITAGIMVDKFAKLQEDQSPRVAIQINLAQVVGDAEARLAALRSALSESEEGGGNTRSPNGSVGPREIRVDPA